MKKLIHPMNKLILTEMTKLSSLPIRMVMFSPVCGYCGKPSDYTVSCDYKLAILACEDSHHKQMAERDAKAWLFYNKKVKYKDYSKDPLFPKTDILDSCIKVKRTSGNIDTDWTILKPSFMDSSDLEYINGIWTIPVIRVRDNIKKYIPIEDLKLSIPEDKYSLVDALVNKLQEGGFYLQDANAYEDALAQEKELENPSISKNDPLIANFIDVVVHPVYGIGRVFNMNALPVPEPTSMDPTKA
jgi:hypothetical protein